jgi:hypothetical protein
MAYEEEDACMSYEEEDTLSDNAITQKRDSGPKR